MPDHSGDAGGASTTITSAPAASQRCSSAYSARANASASCGITLTSAKLSPAGIFVCAMIKQVTGDTVAGDQLGFQFRIVVPVQNQQLCLRRIVFWQQTRTAQQRFWVLSRMRHGFWILDSPANGRQRLRVDHSRPQNARRGNRQIQDRGFDADLRLAAVHDQRNLSRQLRADVFRVRRRNLVGQIGAWRGERKSTFANDRLDERMARPAHANRCAAAPSRCPEFPLRAATPASTGRARMIAKVCPPDSGQSSTQRLRHFVAGDMDDDGIVCRPAFDLKNFGDGLFIQRIGGQAIDRFGRQRDDFAGAQQFRRAPDGVLKKLRRVTLARTSARHAPIRSARRQSGRAWTLSTRDKNRR